MSCTAEVVIRAVDANPDAEPMAKFEVDLGNRAAKALESKDWAELSRLTPASKRSKDPARVAGARKRTTPTAPAPTPVTPS